MKNKLITTYYQKQIASQKERCPPDLPGNNAFRQRTIHRVGYCLVLSLLFSVSVLGLMPHKLRYVTILEPITVIQTGNYIKERFIAGATYIAETYYIERREP